MSLLGDEGQRWRDLIRREPAELLGRVGDELAVPPQHVAGVGQLEEHGPAVDLGRRARDRNSSEVATPKFPPPPRIAQNRSSCSRALAVRNRPSAVTTSIERRVSSDRPKPRAR